MLILLFNPRPRPDLSGRGRGYKDKTPTGFKLILRRAIRLGEYFKLISDIQFWLCARQIASQEF